MKRIRREAKQHGLDVEETEGGKHVKLYVGDRMIPIPRHTEITESTTRQIFKQCEPMFGKDWWR